MSALHLFGRKPQTFSQRTRFSTLVLGASRIIHRIKLAGGGVRLHLTIPIIIRPAAQFREQFCSFFDAERIEGSPNFRNGAHFSVNMPRATRFGNAQAALKQRLAVNA
jgi:hypothetical protein